MSLCRYLYVFLQEIQAEKEVVEEEDGQQECEQQSEIEDGKMMTN